MQRLWTGKAPLKISKKKIPLVDSFNPPLVGKSGISSCRARLALLSNSDSSNLCSITPRLTASFHNCNFLQITMKDRDKHGDPSQACYSGSLLTCIQFHFVFRLVLAKYYLEQFSRFFFFCLGFPFASSANFISLDVHAIFLDVYIVKYLFALLLKVGVIVMLQVIFSSVLVSVEMIISNSVDFPSSSNCSVSISTLKVCCFEI